MTERDATAARVEAVEANVRLPIHPELLAGLARLARVIMVVEMLAAALVPYEVAPAAVVMRKRVLMHSALQVVLVVAEALRTSPELLLYTEPAVVEAAVQR